MSDRETHGEKEQEIKQKIDKLKETINESLGLSNIKISELERELNEFQSELQASTQSTITEQSVDSSKLLRLYKAERSLTDVLQQKIIELEKELTETQVSYKTIQSTNELMNDFKKFFVTELSKMSVPVTDTKKESTRDPAPVDGGLSSQASIEAILTSEHKANKEEKLRLQTENQDLQKELHYYKERNDNLKKELQYRNQEIQSLKKIMQEENASQDESYLTKQSINDEYGYTQEEEFELTKEELNTLKGKFLTLEKEQEETTKQVDKYKKELTDLKRVLGDKNTEIKQLKRGALPSQEENPLAGEQTISETSTLHDQMVGLQEKVTTLETELTEYRKQLNVAESKNRELTNNLKKLEDQSPDKELLNLQLELDKVSKTVWKIEKTINIFDSTINADVPTFDRHLEVYGLLLGKIFNARGYALIIDTLLKHKGKVLTKKMVLNESNTEPHIAIRVLRELHDSKIIHMDEENDQIIWRE